MRETGSGHSPSDSYIQISGTAEEIDCLRKMLLGVAWVSRGDQGEPIVHEKYKPLPDPRDDPKLPPVWQPSLGARKTDPHLMIHREPCDGWHSPSFVVQHLCAYDYSIERYKAQVFILQEAGFECLRSRRGKAGLIWELWLLPGTWASKGALKAAIDKLVKPTWKKESDLVIDWLCRNVRFGTADVCVQRAAMVIDD